MDYLPNDSFPRESKELIAVEISRNGVEVTNYELSLHVLGARPDSGWTAPVAVGALKGYMLPGTIEEPDTYMLWARVDADPEVPVLQVRRVTIT